MLSRWSEQVRVCSGGSLDDGYSWRKYGQKDILGANFPRAYYRCSHSKTLGCLATKQVQKSGEDPSVFKVIYRGSHTCIQASQLTKPMKNSIMEEEPKQELQEIQVQTEEIMSFLDIERFHEEENEELGIREEIFPSYSLPSSPAESKSVETLLFPENIFESNFLSWSPCQMNKIGSDSSIDRLDFDINLAFDTTKLLTEIDTH